jgi:hypothetical protein
MNCYENGQKTPATNWKFPEKKEKSENLAPSSLGSELMCSRLLAIQE